MHVRIQDLRSHLDQEVTIDGWLYNQRRMGKVLFLVVRDGTGFCQCVISKGDAPEELYERARGLTQESSLRITGTVVQSEAGDGSPELHTTALHIVQQSSDYPITPKPHGIDFLLNRRHLHLRSRRPWAILRIRAIVIDEVRSFLNRNGYLLVDSPIITQSAGEDTHTLFALDYFGDQMFLAQTGQLYVEAACQAFGRVYTFGPTFRAEKSKTRRHLTEFWMVEPELAFATLDDLLQTAEDMVLSIVSRVLAECTTELDILERDREPLRRISAPFPRLRHEDAAALLRSETVRDLFARDLTAAESRAKAVEQEIHEKEAAAAAGSLKAHQAGKLAAAIAGLKEELQQLRAEIHEIPGHQALAATFSGDSDLGGANETVLSRLHDQPLFVTHYPRACKAFYMKQNAENPDRVNNFDLLAPEGYGEIIGGSEREDVYEVLARRIEEDGLNQEDYDWYLDLRRYGTVPHGGFGMGIERALCWICGLKHIREVIPFPRLMGRVYPRADGNA